MKSEVEERLKNDNRREKKDVFFCLKEKKIVFGGKIFFFTKCVPHKTKIFTQKCYRK